MISIVIPAHNEESVIENCLAGLLPGVDSGEFEVIVVCNGCTDSTANLVRSVSTRIECMEVEKPSKTLALNVGDANANYFPRVYMDADIRMTYSDVVAMVQKLSKGEQLAVSPSMQMDLSHASWVVRAYYDVWSNLPYCQEGMIGVGVYALSQEGRARFEEFPDIVADDGYVRLQFSRHERSAVHGAYSLVMAPSNLTGLIKIKTRSRLGEYELRQKFPDLYKNDNKEYYSAFSESIIYWKTLPKLLVYLFVNIVTRIRARLAMKKKQPYVWERDESSRLY